MLSINFDTLEQINLRTGVVRRMQAKDENGTVVRSWDDEKGAAIKARRTRDSFSTLALYFYWWRFRVQINLEYSDPLGSLEGEKPIDILARGVEDGLILTRCSCFEVPWETFGRTSEGEAPHR